MRRGMQTCPMCGQQFGSASIGIHIPQCHKKLLKRWEALPPRERGPKPIMPGSSNMVMAPSGPSSSVGGSSSAGGGGYGGVGSAFGEVSKRTTPGGGMPRMGGAGGARGQSTPTAPSSTSGGYDSMPIRPSGTGGISKGQYLDQGAQQYQSTMPRCRYCNRSFAPDRIVKHESCCIEAKGGGGSRKRFNAKKQRLDGFDQYELKAARGGGGGFGGRAGKSTKGGGIPTSMGGGGAKNNWRQQHRDFQQAIRAARATAPPKQYGGGGGGVYGGSRFGPGGGGGYGGTTAMMGGGGGGGGRIRSHHAGGSGLDFARGARGQPGTASRQSSSGGGGQRFTPGMARYGARDDGLGGGGGGPSTGLSAGVRQTGGARGRVASSASTHASNGVGQSMGMQRYGGGGPATNAYDRAPRQPTSAQRHAGAFGGGGDRFSSAGSGMRTTALPGAGGISTSNETSSAMRQAFGGR